MESVGSIIKLARESRKLTLRQIAEGTHISLRHLQSIEEGRYRDLPGGMYNRAFIRAYAEYLGMDSRAVLEKYAAEAPPAEKAPRSRIAVTQASSQSHSSPVMAWSAMLLISVAGIFFSRHWIAEVFSPYFSRSAAGQAPPAQTAAPPPQTVAAPTLPAAMETPQAQTPPAAGPDKTIQLPPADPAPVQTASVLAAPSPPASGSSTPAGKLQIHLQASESCWTSVTSDSNRVLSAELKPGDERSFGAEHQFTIVLGNAGAVRLSINGKPAKPLGKAGQVVKVLITEQNLAEYLPAQNP